MCDIPAKDVFFYAIYGSEFNKETLLALKHDMTLTQALNHQQYVTLREDLAEEARLEAERQ